CKAWWGRDDLLIVSLRGTRFLAYARNKLRNLRPHLSLREAAGDEAISVGRQWDCHAPTSRGSQ
ncbi:MAG TPA: hypothetical protein VEG28_05575, partial [Dehalococcoidia bacterium]|nr:hypothetical protein [Dehalococcoidia bacterium]